MKNSSLFGIIGIAKDPKTEQKSVSCMINQTTPFDQLPQEIKPAFQELKVLKHLNAAGFRKKFGFTCAWLFRKRQIAPTCQSDEGYDTLDYD
jgi:transposase